MIRIRFCFWIVCPFLKLYQSEVRFWIWSEFRVRVSVCTILRVQHKARQLDKATTITMSVSIDHYDRYKPRIRFHYFSENIETKLSYVSYVHVHYVHSALESVCACYGAIEIVVVIIIIIIIMYLCGVVCCRPSSSAVLSLSTLSSSTTRSSPTQRITRRATAPPPLLAPAALTPVTARCITSTRLNAMSSTSSPLSAPCARSVAWLLFCLKVNQLIICLLYTSPSPRD